MRFLAACVLVGCWVAHAAASVQVSLTASDSTWQVPAGGSVVGYTDLYMTIRYDGAAPSQFYAFYLDYIDGRLLAGDPHIQFSSEPLWEELSGSWFPMPWNEQYTFSASDYLGVFPSLPVIICGSDWPVGEITKPLLRINYVLDPSVDASFTAQWRIAGQFNFSGSGAGDGYDRYINPTTTNQITAQVVPGPIPEPRSAAVWCLLSAAALAAPCWRRRRTTERPSD